MMRTIETEATVTASGTLVVATPPDLRPGTYRVVVVLDAPVAPPASAVAVQTDDPWDTMERVGAQLSAQGPLPFNAVEELSASRR